MQFSRDKLQNNNDNNLEFLEFAKSLALNAGAMMKKFENTNFKPTKNINYINEYVADKIERFIQKQISFKYPDHKLFKDHNSDKSSSAEYEWICDYIDGAYCYSKGHRVSVTSVALTQNNVTIVSVIYNPWTNELFHGVRNGGAFLNGSQIKPLSKKIEKGSMINVEWWPWADFDIDTWLHNLSIEKGAYVLHIGSIIHAACLVASGKFDACALGKKMIGKNHEIAAVSLIVKESGCLITDLYGKDINYTDDIDGLLIANIGSHKSLVNSFANFANGKH